MWTSHAARAHDLLALVRTSPRDPQRRHAGLSQLIVDLAAPGVGIRPIQLGGLVAELQTLRALSAGIADALQRGAAPAREAAMVKDLGACFEAKVVATARDLLDTEPALDSPDDLARLLAEAIVHRPGGTLRGGTTEILRGIIARDLVTP